MHTFRITTMLDTIVTETYETQYRSAAIREYCNFVKKSCAMNGAASGLSVEMRRDGVRVLEHFGRKELEDRVTSRLVALDSAPENDNPLDL
jgi:hypothetical protein